MCATCTRLVTAGLVVEDHGAIVTTPMGLAVLMQLPDDCSRAQVDAALLLAAGRIEDGEVLPFGVPGPDTPQ